MSKKIVIIGGGPAGYTAALRASQLGAKVTLIEAGHLGGTCLNVGCIPTKSLLSSSEIWRKYQSFLMQDEETLVPWNRIMAHKNEAVQKLRAGVNILLKTGKIDVISGFASLQEGGVAVKNGEDHRFVAADATIIATGSSPILPPIQGTDLEGVMTSDDMILSNDPYPESITIVGAGIIGIEFATIFSELGKKVNVVEASSSILPMVDFQIANQLKRKLENNGISFYLNQKVEAIEKDKDGFLHVKLPDQKIKSNMVLIAVGRKANIDNLHLSDLGVEVNRGRIKTNSFYQTTNENVYAVGDCSSPIMLAHVAMAEARVAVEHCLGKDSKPINYEFVPQCIYSHPEIATVGITEMEAKKRGFDTEVGIFPLTASGKAMIEGETTGLIKIVSEKQYRRVLGVHLLAPHATEMIAEACLALTLETTVDELLDTIHPHPTIVEGVPEAILSINNEAIHMPMK